MIIHLQFQFREKLQAGLVIWMEIRFIFQISLSNLNYSSEKSAVRQEEKGYYERSVTRKPSTLLPESV